MPVASCAPQPTSGFTACAHTTASHSYETALYGVAVDTRPVKDVLCHSVTPMTERYTLGHVPEAMRLATFRFEEHLGAPDAPSAATEPTPAAAALAPPRIARPARRGVAEPTGRRQLDSDPGHTGPNMQRT